MILDEAYCEFSLAIGDPYASLDLLREHPNLVLLRTFSKVYGLAALRVGYALCGSEDFRVAVDQVRQPFYLNSRGPGRGGRGAAPSGRGRATGDADAGRAHGLEEEVRRQGLWVADSDANFIWLHLPEELEEAELVKGLRGTWGAGSRRDLAGPRGSTAGHRGH